MSEFKYKWDEDITSAAYPMGRAYGDWEFIYVPNPDVDDATDRKIRDIVHSDWGDPEWTDRSIYGKAWRTARWLFWCAVYFPRRRYNSVVAMLLAQKRTTAPWTEHEVEGFAETGSPYHEG